MPLPTQEIAEQVLGDWVQKLTTMTIKDGVQFVTFNENRFWQLIEYAMADDFPTVMTDFGVLHSWGENKIMVRNFVWIGCSSHHAITLSHADR